MTKQSNQKLTAAIVGAVLGVAIGVCLDTFSWGKALVNESYDLLLVARGDIKADQAAIVYLDEVSFQKLNQPLNAPWDRALHAKLIDRLTAAGARAVAFDIVFSDANPDKAASDQALADAIRRNGHVVLAADNIPIGPKAYKTIPPFQLLSDTAANIGSAETVPDSDLIIRTHTPRGDNPLSSLSWATADTLKLPVTQNPDAEMQARWLNYYGHPGLIPGYSYYEALDPTVVPDTAFSNKVVFVGARIMTKFAGERKDEYPSPFSAFAVDKNSMFMPGVEIQATAFLNLLRQDWLRRLPQWLEMAILAVTGIFFGVTLVLCRPLGATAVAVGGFVLVSLLTYFLLFRMELTWFPVLIVGVQIGIALGWSVLFNSIQLYVQKRLVEQALTRFLPPNLVKKFAGNPELLQPGAQKQTVTLFFSDIASFTSISEGMDSDHLAQLMNKYFETAVSQCIHKTDGAVAKYIGDAIFCFWNAPDPQVDHALRACQAALHFRDTDNHSVNGTRLHTRIGLHTGLANVGNFGSVERVDYTALGENVNLASRLEGLNKHLGTSRVMSGETQKCIGDQLVTRFLGRFRLKGFEKAVEVYELVGWPQEAESTRSWREAFAAGLKSFQEGRLAEAAEAFGRTLQIKPGDGPSEFYQSRIEEVESAIPEGWTGDVELKEK